MPFYEYQCQSCDHRVEVLQKISDAPLVSCPECNEPALKKLISAAGFRLKGTGWYETDFKNSGSTPSKDESGPDGGGTTASRDQARETDSGKSDKAKTGSPDQSKAA
ncbi:MAG: zinc ribbon domain-containing protein [Gammaproteobacteria bacterium]|nr:zinc ribbon domain-containing protein [Gammaproteobacteria bacterium]